MAKDSIVLAGHLIFALFTILMVWYSVGQTGVDVRPFEWSVHVKAKRSDELNVSLVEPIWRDVGVHAAPVRDGTDGDESAILPRFEVNF